MFWHVALMCSRYMCDFVTWCGVQVASRGCKNANHKLYPFHHICMHGHVFKCSSQAQLVVTLEADVFVRPVCGAHARNILGGSNIHVYIGRQVSLVVNFNPPVEADSRTAAFDTYLHRIGRSGRFGRKGAAFNLVTGVAENAVIDELADYFKIEIPDLPHDDDEKFKELLKEAGLHEAM